MKQMDETIRIKHFERTCRTLRTQIKSMQESHRFTVSQISHEIRNPVTMINSSLQIIEKEHPEVQDFTLWKETMEDMQYLRRLLDELSSYNNGGALHLKPIQTEEWMNQTMASFDLVNTSEKISFSYYAESPLPVISADPIKLRQAFINLLRNALEALPCEGNVSLTVSSQEGCVCIEVTDNGCGIPKEHMETLFEPFITHKPTGTGLGLAITKRIIEAHRGSISCVSEEGVGTAFTVLLPISSS